MKVGLPGKLAIALFVVAIGLYASRTLLRAPELISNPIAYNIAFVDAVSAGLRADLGAPKAGPSSVSPANAVYRLCSAQELIRLPDRLDCIVALPTPERPSCKNVNGCGELQFHQTVMADNTLRNSITAAIISPCAALAKGRELDSRLTTPRYGLQRNALGYDEQLLGCGGVFLVRGRIRSVSGRSIVFRFAT